jgi:hypothetical protein
VRQLPPDLQRKADEILAAYGGLKGLAYRPAWLVNIVLKSFFNESESNEIQKFLKSK